MTGTPSLFLSSQARCLDVFQVDPTAAKMLWSQPKQTGDLINDAMHEMLIYKPKAMTCHDDDESLDFCRLGTWQKGTFSSENLGNNISLGLF